MWYGNRRPMTGSLMASDRFPLLSRRCFCAATLVGNTAVLAQAAAPSVPLLLSEAVDLSFVSPLLKVIEHAAGFRWASSVVPFGRMMRMVEQGEAVGFGISPTAERKVQLAFSRSIFEGAIWAVSRADRRLAMRHVQDLEGQVVCASRTAAYGIEIGDPTFARINVQAVSGVLAQRLRTLEARHCDVLLVTARNGEADSIRARLRAAGADPREYVLSEAPVAIEGVHFAVAKAGPFAKWLASIDSAILAERSEIDRLSSKVG